jgi:hypothetical protein
MDQQTLKQLMRYDPLTGEFFWKTGAHKGKRAGCVSSNGYIKIVHKRKDYQAHRLAFLYVTGRMPVSDIDHMNCNRADNRLVNLREVSRSVNAHNRAKANTNNKCGWAGVHQLRGKWVSQIVLPNRSKQHLGVFETAEEAHLTYLLAKEVYFGNR